MVPSASVDVLACPTAPLERLSAVKLESVTPASAITLFRVPAMSLALMPTACPAFARLAICRCSLCSGDSVVFSLSLASSDANHSSSFA